MQNEFIIIKEYCRKSQLDPSFLLSLEEVGLLDVHMIDGEKYMYVSQLPKLEQYSRMFYDLSINTEGIDAIEHLLMRITTMQQELSTLRNRLSLYESVDY